LDNFAFVTEIYKEGKKKNNKSNRKINILTRSVIGNVNGIV
jgi:predicted membrane protein